jgi:hypothetical protein
MPHEPGAQRLVLTRVFSALASPVLIVGAVVGGVACQGDIGDPPAAPRLGAPWAAGAGALPAAPGSGEVAAADAQMQAANPELFEIARSYFPEEVSTRAPERLFRLTRAQLDVTTAALLPEHYTRSAAEVMPGDPLQTNYEYAANLSFNQANFTPYVDWVAQLAASVRAMPASVIPCAATPDSPSCLEPAAKQFVARAFRGVASAATLDRYAQFYLASVRAVGFADATAELVEATLTSPHYVFRSEVPASDPGLAAAQQLQSLSYTLADAPPAALGIATAAPAAAPAAAAALDPTIDQLLATPAARDKLVRFFVSWLEVKEADEFALAPEVYPEFTPEVALAAIEETNAFLKHQLAAAAPALKDITQSTQSFVSEALASIYGLRSVSPTGLTPLDPTQRLGIFTQPAVIASHSGPTTTRLVKRGVFFTRKVMCLPLGLPPAGVNTTLPPVENATERQRVETATASPACLGCHNYINPFGFMQENYDATGRWRTLDKGLHIDASIHLSVLDEGPLDTKTPVDALRGLTNSMRFQQCFARQLFRFYLGRDEAAGDDPVLRRMFFGFADGGTQDIVGMLRTLARSSSISPTMENR